MNEHYLISVIVPIYNVENYLKKCIESIINQEYRYLQIILVDDGSLDRSGDICDEYALVDERIEVIHKENGGLVSARKHGLALAKGEYIGFVDGDDYIDPTFYQRLLAKIVESGADFVHSCFISEDNAVEVVNNPYEPGIFDLSDIQAEFIKNYILQLDGDLHMDHNLVSKLFKADIIKKSYLEVPDFQSRGEDMLAVCDCILNCKKIYLDTKAGYHYVMRNDSITHCNNIEGIIDFASLYKCLMNLFGKYGVLETLREELGIYFKDTFLDFLSLASKHMIIPRYEFSDIDSIKGKKIVLYGAGRVGQGYYAHICKYDEIKVIAWADKNYERFHYDYREVISSDAIVDYDYDLLIIAVMKESLAETMKKELMQIGISESKIIWRKPSKILDIENKK